MIFGSEADPPKVVEAHRRCADVHLKGAPHPKGGVHEPRSEAESAVRKEKIHAPEGCTHTHTCTVRIARTNRAHVAKKLTHPKGARK